MVVFVCNLLNLEDDTYLNGTGAVSAMIEGDSGEIDYTHNQKILKSVSSAQRAQEQTLASHDFLKEWASAVKKPIDFITNRIGQVINSHHI